MQTLLSGLNRDLNKGVASIAVTCLPVRVGSKLGTCKRTHSLRVDRLLCFCCEQVSQDYVHIFGGMRQATAPRADPCLTPVRIHVMIPLLAPHLCRDRSGVRKRGINRDQLLSVFGILQQ